MNKVLCFLLIAAVVAQICARPDDKAAPAKEAAKAKDAIAAKPAGEAKAAGDKLKGAAEGIVGNAKDAEKDVADDAEDVEPPKPKPKKHHHKHHSMISGMIETGAQMMESVFDIVPFM